MIATSPPRSSIWAAGCVVARRSSSGEPEYLVVHRPRYDDWSLPKGKVDKGETFLETALRELDEETGIIGHSPRRIGSVGYDTKAGNAKVVQWWLVENQSGKFRRNAEVDKVKWLTRAKAKKKLDYRNDRAVLDRAHRMYLAESAGTVFLVRHAWAGTRKESVETASDKRRKLDKRGKKQVKAIRDELLSHPLTRIVSSDYKRCKATVKPLATRLGISVELERDLAEGTPPERLEKLISELPAEAVVLCSHGDVIAAFIGLLAAEGYDMKGPVEAEKGSIWKLQTAKGRVVKGSYIPPS